MLNPHDGATERVRGLSIGAAGPEDLHAVVDVLISSRRAFIPYAPIAHDERSVERWLKGLIALDGCVSVARLNGAVVGMIAVHAGDRLNWIDQLYLAPAYVGIGIGRELLAHGLRVLGRERPVRLYSFQANGDARRFYERAGFKAIAFSDGSLNEERCPDVLYELEAIPAGKRRPAIFVIDMLNDCFGHAPLRRLRPSLCSSINELTAMARAAGCPVIWVRQEFEPDLSDAMLEMKSRNIHMFIKGTAGPRVLDELDRSDDDLEVVKKRYSMFFRTDLDALLRRLGTDQVILAGVNTHACIRVAALDAYQRDFEVLIVRECVASKDARHHDVTMDYLDGGIARVVTLRELGERFLAGRAG